MFRSIYFLVLLASSNLCLCYHHKTQGKHHDVIPSKIHRNTNHRRRIPRTSPHRRYDDLEDDGQVAQIDVASFIQSSNEYGALDGYRPHTSEKKSSKNTKYDKYKQIDKSENYLNEMPHNFKENLQRIDDKNEIDALPSSVFGGYGEKSHKDRSIENSKYKESQPLKKKGGFKLQFPFFSHKSDKAHEKKKVKKSGKSKTKKHTDNFAQEQLHEKKPYIMRDQDEEVAVERVKKRSYIERVCPACRRKFIDQEQKARKRKSPKMVHNSRQYFQQITNQDRTTSNPEELLFQQENTDYDRFTDQDVEENKPPKARQKRGEVDEKRHETQTPEENRQIQQVLINKDRQLKELDEVQKRIDYVHIQRGNDNKVSH